MATPDIRGEHVAKKKPVRRGKAANRKAAADTRRKAGPGAKRGSRPRKRAACTYVLNCVPSRDTARDWTFQDAARTRQARRAAIPAAKDLRETWWPPGDQKATGSCVGWATADGVLRWHFVQAKRLPTDERLSMRYVWMASKETDVFTSRPTTFIESEGTSLKAALDVCRQFGVVRDSVVPFESGRLYGDSTNTFYALAAQLRIASYFNLGLDPAHWREWLATSGPILTRLNVDDTWMNATATKGRLDVYEPATIQGGHAVAFVGYTAGGFIVRNSWGKSWGDGGFAYASNAYAAAAFDEAYGVTV